jgi:hypothetical protein
MRAASWNVRKAAGNEVPGESEDVDASSDFSLSGDGVTGDGVTPPPPPAEGDVGVPGAGSVHASVFTVQVLWF